jgi:hypothetical protein
LLTLLGYNCDLFMDKQEFYSSQMQLQLNNPQQFLTE